MAKYYQKIIILIFFSLMNIGNIYGQKLDSLHKIVVTQKGFEKARSYENIAKLSHKNKLIDEAISHYNLSIELYEKLDSFKYKTKALFSLGRLHYSERNYNDAILTFSKSLETTKKHHLTKLMPMQYNALGITYKAKGDYPKSLSVYQKALLAYEEENNDKGKAATLSNLSIVYRKFNKIDKATTYALKAYEIGVKFGDDFQTGKYLLNISNLYDSKEEYKKALQYGFQALESFKKAETPPQISSALTNIGVTYEKMGDYEKAEKHLFEALEMALPTQYKIGNIYFNIGDLNRIQGRYNEALKYYKLADKNEQFSSIGNLKPLIYQNISIVNDSLKNYKSAYIYHVKYIDLKDSLTGENIQKEIEELNTKYETEKKNHRIDLLEKENEISDIKNKRYKILGGLIGIALLLLMLVGYFSYKTKLEKSKTNEALFQQKLLRSQMNPHFLFNALFSIQGFMMKNGAKPASFYLSTFAKLMRSILNNSQKEEITLEEEIITITNYLELEKLRHPDKFDFNISVDPILETDITLIPPMLAQPFIENAVKHGVVDLNYQGKINIEFKKERNYLVVTISDNGKGFKNLKGNTKHKSASLQITKERLNLLNKDKNNQISFKIVNNKDNDNSISGTIVTFVIPFIESEY